MIGHRDIRVAARRRGSIYLATLGATMIVTVIGLSALLAVRVRNREQSTTAVAVKTRVAAQSAIEWALFKIAGDPNWRTRYTHDTWAPEVTLGEVTLTFKLLDEQDADLADDAYDAVRLVAKAHSDAAVRLCSLLLQPNRPRASLLTNGGAESGLGDWTGLGHCSVTSVNDNSHSGAACLVAKNRDFGYEGPQQEITNRVSSGQTYYTEVWVRMAGGPDNVKVSVYVETTDGPRWFSLPRVFVGTEWTEITGTIRTLWTGTLIAAHWRVETTWDKKDIYIDDAVLVEGTTPPASTVTLTPVPGSWRQDVLP